MPARKPFVAANWKMYKTINEARAFVEEFRKLGPWGGVRVAICPPAIALEAVVKGLEGSGILTGAQNSYFENEGAFTGELSVKQARDTGVACTIIGHSERRRVFGESDELINLKLKACVREKVQPIFCIGETLEEREGGKAEDVLLRQLCRGLDGIGADSMENLVIAYEPVWAIGTGKNATPEQAQETHAFVRKVLEKQVSAAVGSGTPILYGGSVKPENIDSLMQGPDLDGALVGGASLKAASFAAIVKGVALARGA